MKRDLLADIADAMQIVPTLLFVSGCSSNFAIVQCAQSCANLELSFVYHEADGEVDCACIPQPKPTQEIP